MMATHTNKDSRNITHLIKPDTVGAEIGVWMGNTSTLFLKNKIKKLYMVDAYSIEPYKDNSEMSYQEYLAKYQLGVVIVMASATVLVSAAPRRCHSNRPHSTE